MNKLIHNVETGEIVEVPLSAEELKQNAELQSQLEAEQELKAERFTAKAALLERLGITEAEARLLLN